ncbi:MAG: mannose-6-phosphate isomerase, class I [Edaphocola sp.]
MTTQPIFRIKGTIQNYAWGGHEYIAQLLHQPNTGQQPQAEYWMGAHPSAPSKIMLGEGEISLREAIGNAPEAMIGKDTWRRFGELPYLFKILDVKDMLSIQVHPSKSEAEKGFDAEEAAGIPINAAHRNYKDRNHKPEVMVALGEFWLLHGFLAKEKIAAVLAQTPELQPLLPYFADKDIFKLYRYLMELPQADVDAMLLPLVKRERASYNEGKLAKSAPGWWTAKHYRQDIPDSELDRGIFSIYLFNIVKIGEGDGIFQGAGVPHAYLEGQNVELMANSDNVLRGGLTPKHIDVPELLKHTLFDSVTPKILSGSALVNGEVPYPCPVPDFGLNAIKLAAGEKLASKSFSMEIIVVIKGKLSLKTQGISLTLHQGASAAIVAHTAFEVVAEENLLAFKAFVPQP